MARAAHWLVLSHPEEYPFERILKQKNKTVLWDVGLNLQDNESLSQMKARDRIIFMSSSNKKCMVGELQVTAAPIPDPRQEEPNSKLYRAEGESKPFYNVSMKYARKFARAIDWADIEDITDAKLQNLPKLVDGKSIYQIEEAHYRYFLYMLKSPSTTGARASAGTVEEISTPIITEDEITDREELGSGQFGQVYRAKFRHQPVAVKVLYVNPSELTEDELKRVKLEVEILRNMHCPHIIKFFGASITDSSVSIVTELCSKGELGTLLQDSRKPLDLYTKLRMARDIAVGMNWLHSSKPVQFLHRDLKPSNLLVDDNYRIKICDFGFCQVKDPQLKRLQSKGAVGTLMYMAPELLRNEDFSEKIDVYSFGLILWEIITREKLFPDIGEKDAVKLKEMVLSGQRPIIPDEYGFIKNLIESCWADSPDARPSFDQISYHLTDMLLENAIEDPLGREFWRGLELHGVAEIEWPVFESELRREINDGYEAQIDDILSESPSNEELTNASDYQLNYFASRGTAQSRRVAEIFKMRYMDESGFLDEDDIDLEIKCLYHLLQVDQNRGKVISKKWGDVLRWFGPIKDNNGYPGFLGRIKRVLKLPYFHGPLSEKSALHSLRNERVGSFLLRFSGKPGAFSLSYVTPEERVAHRRFYFCPNDNAFFKFNHQKFYSIQALLGAFQKQNIIIDGKESSVYRCLFDSSKSGNNYIVDEDHDFMEE